MELDDFKSSWKAHHGAPDALHLHLLREGALEKARHGLRPLFWGQVLQGIGGLLLMVWAGTFWGSQLRVPHLLVTGLVLHAYGLLLVLLTARMLYLLRTLDYGAPVMEIQAGLAVLRRTYIRGGLVIGLPWWVLWVPFMELVFHSLFGVDMFLHAPQILWIGLGVGLPGWLGTLCFDRWAKGRPVGARIERSLAGPGLNEAQRRLEEIARFRAQAAD